jgi:hypothetical protein
MTIRQYPEQNPSTNVSERPFPIWAMLSAIIIVPAGLYLASGILEGFLAADDFGWLSTARDQAWPPIFSFGSFDHFYRPVIRAWFFWGGSPLSRLASLLPLPQLVSSSG